MHRDYDPKEIEPKWQKKWEDSGQDYAKEDSGKPKYYSLIEFPYPSGEGLHTGHVRSYTAMDIISRKRRREGFDVLYPIGWDAFGLPTENFALKTGKDPRVITKENTDNFRRQLKALGISFDWSREINTTDPKYYKWTQWIFLKFLEQGLAYKAKSLVNWCPKDKIVLANEEVVNGCCERCGTEVEKREKEQWMLAITKYADRLEKDLDDVDYLPRIKLQQKNWIGKSEGAEINFAVKDSAENIKVFTTRPDTIFGATFLALSPRKAKELFDEDFGIVEETEREHKEKLGADIGHKAINPATKQEIPIWVVNYVSSDYGTGAIMGVPADDERDMEFAEKFGLPIVKDYPKAGFEDFGKRVTKFKLRDWVFSRQRYWGEPIPVVFCEKCGTVPMPEEDLPVLLPEVKNYQPTDTGESPLANISEWVNTTCPKCGGPAKRETDVMPQWAGSSWYFLRYADPHNNEEFASKDALRYWMPVDWYNGGMEHTTLHLLYSRFWNKFLFELKLVPTSEPYMKRTSHGFILGEGGEKMSKSRGNVVNPDSVVERFGADTLRLYEMFMGPFDQAITWSEASLVGPRRFLERVWKLIEKVSKDEHQISKDALFDMNMAIKKVSEDIESMSFNTAVSAMMMWVNNLDKRESISALEYEILLKLLAPFAPHIVEELWHELGNDGSIHLEPWPTYDVKKLEKDEVTVAVQINGKVRASITVPSNTEESTMQNMALQSPEVAKWLTDRQVVKIIVVPNKLVNIVTT